MVEPHGPLCWGATVSSVVLLLMFPFGAADVFDYIMHGCILSIYDANPFYAAAQEFPQDPFIAYVTWRELRLGPVVLALPWMFLLFSLMVRRRSKKNEEYSIILGL